jgi:hypothetical protein
MSNIINSVKDKLTNAAYGNRNEDVDRNIADNVDYYRFEPESAVRERLNELEEEWDVERTVELNASLVVLTGVILAATVSKKWLILPALVTGFLAQHAIKNWSAPLGFFGHLRTRKEIAKEKFGLSEVLKNGPSRMDG